MAYWQPQRRQYRRAPACPTLLLLICLATHLLAAYAASKWTVLVYMLADNDLECFGIQDLSEMMRGMAVEPTGCVTGACGSTCAADMVQVGSTSCSQGVQPRCCPSAAYPDVMVLVDRGHISCSVSTQNTGSLDFTPITSAWTTARDLLILPGGSVQTLRDYGEIDMSNPLNLQAFIQRGLQRYPPSADRKYLLVFWDHGGGWEGYGIDHTCSPLDTYNTERGCDMLTLTTLQQGVQQGLSGSGLSKLDIVGFDACIMSMYEVAGSLLDVSSYLLGSQLLEPGHGWDYSFLNEITKAQGSGGTVSAAQTASWVTDYYFGQGATYHSSGLTLALLDLGSAFTDFRTAMADLTTAMQDKFTTTPAYGLAVLRARRDMASIPGAEDNADLGTVLSVLASLSIESPTVASKAAAARTKYLACIKVFRSDGSLAAATAVAIYFPQTSASYLSWYDNAAQAFPTIAPWKATLGALFTAAADAGGSSGLGIEFLLNSTAIPYYNYELSVYMLMGQLNSDLALKASVIGGFMDPRNDRVVLTGTAVAAVSSTRVAGAWSARLYLLQQDIDRDGNPEGLSLMYGRETDTADSLTLEADVFYAATCEDDAAAMKTGQLIWRYDKTTGDESFQLFVQNSVSSTSSSIGEVPSSAGGYVVAGLKAVDGGQGTVSSTATLYDYFHYSSCMKWGYAVGDSLSMKVGDLSSLLAVLDLDLSTDLAMLLVAEDAANGRAVLPGFLEPVKMTDQGCQCKMPWGYNGQLYDGVCANPDGKPLGAWCEIETGSCRNYSVIAARPASQQTFDYCKATTTLSGCQCLAQWSNAAESGKVYYGSCAPADPPSTTASWCQVDEASCPTPYRAHAMAGANGSAWDYCATATQSACECANTWEYNSTQYAGVCRTGLPFTDKQGNPSTAAAASSWCIVSDPSTCDSKLVVEGYHADECTPEGGRRTFGGAPCIFPVLYHGIPVYDCLNYDHSTPGVTVDEWCFTNTTTGDTDLCAPRKCADRLANLCTDQPPSTTNFDAYSTPACLDQLCYFRQNPASASACPDDTGTEVSDTNDAIATLSINNGFGQLLATKYSSGGSLDAYCDTVYGQRCMARVLDPACPAISRDAVTGAYSVAANSPGLCNSTCFLAMCKVHINHGWTKCYDSEEAQKINFKLFELFESQCGAAYVHPADLKCDAVLAAAAQQQICAASTLLTDVSATFSDGAAAANAASYAPSTTCVWKIAPPNAVFINLTLTALDTEAVYDRVVVEDAEKVLATYSGKGLAQASKLLTTDTGLMVVTFTSDATFNGKGFTATYSSSDNPGVAQPLCAKDLRLVEVKLTTKAFAEEIAWVISKRQSGTVPVYAYGGSLPVGSVSGYAATGIVIGPTSYRSYRTTLLYGCMPIQAYNLMLFDSNGDGWGGGRIILTELKDGLGLTLANQTLSASKSTTAFDVLDQINTRGGAYDINRNLGAYYAIGDISFQGETPDTITLRRIDALRTAVASLLNTDKTFVTVNTANIRLKPSTGRRSLQHAAAASEHADHTALSSTEHGMGPGFFAAIGAEEVREGVEAEDVRDDAPLPGLPTAEGEGDRAPELTIVTPRAWHEKLSTEEHATASGDGGSAGGQVVEARDGQSARGSMLQALRRLSPSALDSLLGPRLVGSVIPLRHKAAVARRRGMVEVGVRGGRSVSDPADVGPALGTPRTVTYEDLLRLLAQSEGRSVSSEPRVFAASVESFSVAPTTTHPQPTPFRVEPAHSPLDDGDIPEPVKGAGVAVPLVADLGATLPAPGRRRLTSAHADAFNGLFQHPSRALLQNGTAPPPPPPAILTVTLVEVKIAGYTTKQAAADAAEELRKLIYNHQLSDALAGLGWTGADPLDYEYRIDGKDGIGQAINQFFKRAFRDKTTVYIIAGCTAGGGALLAMITVWLCSPAGRKTIRRKDQLRPLASKRHLIAQAAARSKQGGAAKVVAAGPSSGSLYDPYNNHAPPPAAVPSYLTMNSGYDSPKGSKRTSRSSTLTSQARAETLAGDSSRRGATTWSQSSPSPTNSMRPSPQRVAPQPPPPRFDMPGAAPQYAAQQYAPPPPAQQYGGSPQYGNSPRSSNNQQFGGGQQYSSQQYGSQQYGSQQYGSQHQSSHLSNQQYGSQLSNQQFGSQHSSSMQPAMQGPRGAQYINSSGTRARPIAEASSPRGSYLVVDEVVTEQPPQQHRHGGVHHRQDGRQDGGWAQEPQLHEVPGGADPAWHEQESRRQYQQGIELAQHSGLQMRMAARQQDRTTGW